MTTKLSPTHDALFQSVSFRRHTHDANPQNTQGVSPLSTHTRASFQASPPQTPKTWRPQCQWLHSHQRLESLAPNNDVPPSLRLVVNYELLQTPPGVVTRVEVETCLPSPFRLVQNLLQAPPGAVTRDEACLPSVVGLLPTLTPVSLRRYLHARPADAEDVVASDAVRSAKSL